VETQYGKQAGQEYLHGQRRNIQNDGPIIGPYGVNKEGSGDMYDKGASLLNMLRTAINDDAKWRNILRGLGKTFYHQTVTGQQVIAYINKEAGRDFSRVFAQYLTHAELPVLEMRLEKGQLLGRWVASVPNFDLPVRVRTKGGEYRFVTPTTKWAVLDLPGVTKDNVEVDTFNYYVGVLVD
jgi:hypothetical protein